MDYNPRQQRLFKIKKFNLVLEELGLPTFGLSDLEQVMLYFIQKS